MKNREMRLVASVHQASRFVTQEAGRTPALRTLAARLARHDERIQTTLTGLVGMHKAQGGEGRQIRGLREDVRIRYMIPIGRAGKKLLKFAGVDRALTTPGKRATSEEVVRAARAMAKAVKPRWALFVEVGFAKDTLEPFKRATEELSRRAVHWDAGRKQYSAMLRTLADELREGRAVIDVVDAMLLDRMRTDRELRLRWSVAKKVGPRMGRPLKRTRAAGPPAPDS